MLSLRHTRHDGTLETRAWLFASHVPFMCPKGAFSLAIAPVFSSGLGPGPGLAGLVLVLLISRDRMDIVRKSILVCTVRHRYGTVRHIRHGSQDGAVRRTK